jgi:heme-degrading monooxygenase HmoA
MIIRAWKAQALSQNVDAYARHFREAVLPELEEIPGHTGAYLLRRDAGTHVELVVLTLWESMDAVKRFSGTPPERAVVEPAAEAVLERFDETVQHFEIVHSTVLQPESGGLDAHTA